MIQSHAFVTVVLRYLVNDEKAELQSEVGQLCINAYELNERFKVLYNEMVQKGLFQKSPDSNL